MTQTPDPAGEGVAAQNTAREDTPPPPPPPPPTPEPDPDPAPVCSQDKKPTQKQLDEAKSKLQKYLKGCRGQAAVDKVNGEFDKNKDGKLSRSEMLALIKKIGLGWPYWYEDWCSGVMTAIDKDKDAQATEQELLDFLDSIGLGGTGQCAIEDGPEAP